MTFDHVREWKQEFEASGWWHSFELPDGSVLEGKCNLAGLKERLAVFPLPSDLTGKRALDVGTWDGWFAFELAKRGAEVVAIDCWDNPRFREMRRLLKFETRVEYRLMDVYDISPETLGRLRRGHVHGRPLPSQTSAAGPGARLFGDAPPGMRRFVRASRTAYAEPGVCRPPGHGVFRDRRVRRPDRQLGGAQHVSVWPGSAGPRVSRARNWWAICNTALHSHATGTGCRRSRNGASNRS